MKRNRVIEGKKEERFASLTLMRYCSYYERH